MCLTEAVDGVGLRWKRFQEPEHPSMGWMRRMQRRRKGRRFPKRREKTTGHDATGIPWKEKRSAVMDIGKRSSVERTERHSASLPGVLCPCWKWCPSSGDTRGQSVWIQQLKPPSSSSLSMDSAIRGGIQKDTSGPKTICTPHLELSITAPIMGMFAFMRV